MHSCAQSDSPTQNTVIFVALRRFKVRFKVLINVNSVAGGVNKSLK